MAALHEDTLLLFTLFLLFHPSFSILGNNITDEQALLAFKAGLISDPFQLTASWNESTSFCEWAGITCGHKHQRVVQVNLSSSNLQGSLSPAIGNLSFLRVILLQKNSLTGIIPSEIGRLSRLQMLSLANNSFSGEIPKNISQCRLLNSIQLGGNNLTGKLPVEFQSLSKLQLMYVYRNKLTGRIPPQYGNLSSLIHFAVDENNLQGDIPNDFGKLKSLGYISFRSNNLSGMVPVSLLNLSLVKIDLQSNQFEGSLSLPPNLSGTGTFPRLEFLSVAHNRFIGHIPLWLSYALNIEVIELSDNYFTGEVPNFGSLKHLRILSFYENEHLGSEKSRDLRFLAPLTNCTDLQYLDFGGCNFGGDLPPYIANISNLNTFNIGDNYISGKIPTEICQLINLERLVLMDNQLSGIIPNTIGKLPKLFLLILERNKLLGKIPSSLGNVTMLSVLTISSNNLHGVIPSSLANCKFLLHIDLSANSLSGFIPKGLFYSNWGLVHLDISHNNLTSPLPLEIGLKSLTFLNFSNNHFFGEIPKSFRFLSSVETLDLSSNHLSGEIPSFLANLSSLTHLSLSNNDLEGEVPLEGVFGNKNGVFLDGNSKLCGGIQELHLPKCTTKEISKKSRMSLRLKMGISISCGILGSVLVVLFIWTYLHRRRNKSISLESQTTKELKPMVSYRSLHNATSGFSLENLIGSGKFSSVYKGNLDEQEKVVAIKVIKLQVKGASKSFIAECEALRHIRHRNLVKVVSSCSSIDYQGNDFKAIIYEYMDEGNLETWLHHHSKENDQNNECTNLSLLERVNIGIDIACAPHYLHVECGTPLVHCDLKPSNVLLDCDLIAHVSDFGLARFLPEAAHTSSLGVKGTVGYAAP
ncbi:probable LRR receptor-like serine/threonine-protein kinase At3g47570 [Ipomoea triloba]|uniref:probable LRR receptor-like serine/threonine-protein kinase At3g47570 n=1 Tax=Ipomoea triloba TaxID=35885 RepID=UPI00125E80F1|nr:probable LRR receptor-like serine/threonine-protein kinase At3g47570 [Ipomoea triloba]